MYKQLERVVEGSGEDKIVIMYNKKTVAIIMKGKTDVVDAEGFSKVMKTSWGNYNLVML